MTTKPSLASIDVVDGIVRDFAAEVLRSPRRPDFMAWLEFECRRMNNLFMGDYGADKYLKGAWKCEDQVDSFVQRVLV